MNNNFSIPNQLHFQKNNNERPWDSDSDSQPLKKQKKDTKEGFDAINSPYKAHCLDKSLSVRSKTPELDSLKISNKTIVDIFASSKYNIEEISQEHLEFLKKNREKITSLYFPEDFHLTSIKLQGILRFFPNIVSLKLEGESITDDHLQKVKELKSLKELRVTDSAITDSGLIAIAPLCRKLLFLDLSENESITDNSLQNQVFNCPDLKTIDLTDCDRITDKSVQDIAKYCLKLHALALESCKKISDKSLEALAKYSKGLTGLDLMDCELITDYGLKTLSKGCRDLQQLDISFCPLITENGIEAIITNCKGLRRLSLVKCPNITENMVYQFKKLHPNLEIMDRSPSEIMGEKKS